MPQKFHEWMENRVKSEAVSDWLTVENNPVVRKVAESLAQQKRRLAERYGQKTADRIIAWTLAGGFVPLPGFQVALLLGLLGVSELARGLKRNRTAVEASDEAECERVANEVQKDMESNPAKRQRA
jgi:hypothetical protein